MKCKPEKPCARKWANCLYERPILKNRAKFGRVGVPCLGCELRDQNTRNGGSKKEHNSRRPCSGIHFNSSVLPTPFTVCPHRAELPASLAFPSPSQQLLVRQRADQRTWDSLATAFPRTELRATRSTPLPFAPDSRNRQYRDRSSLAASPYVRYFCHAPSPERC